MGLQLPLTLWKSESMPARGGRRRTFLRSKSKAEAGKGCTCSRMGQKRVAASGRRDVLYCGDGDKLGPRPHLQLPVEDVGTPTCHF